MKSRKLALGSIAAAVMAFGLAGPAAAVTFSAASGSLAASAAFDIVGGNLQVVLTNTSTADALIPTDILTAVYFDLTGSPTLLPISALLSSGSTVAFGPVNGGNVGGEWGYATFGTPIHEGASSTGLGIFGSPNFNGSNLQGPAGLDGLQYGITSAGDNLATGNAPVTGGNALIKNSVTFLMGSLPPNFVLSQISNVSFQYGTALTDPHIPAVPEPESYAMMLAGLGLLGLMARRRKQNDAAV